MNAFERARRLAHQRLAVAYANDGYLPSGNEKTLVIIDMQTSFLRDDCFYDKEGNGPCCEIITGICKTIQYAMINGWGIIIVEYTGNGETHEDILEAVSRYRHVEFVGKTEPNGGEKILHCLVANPGWSTDILMCGIYGDCCVAQTVSGIFDGSDLAEVCVIEDLVYPDYEPHRKEDGDRVLIETLEELNISKGLEV